MPRITTGDPRVIEIVPLHISGKKLRFPTIITQFEDKWTPRWQEDYVYGRQDPISFFGGTSRELTLGFRVIADDPAEAAANMADIQKLIQYQYPSFKVRRTASRRGAYGINTLKAPPYFALKVMDTIGQGTSHIRGYITSGITVNPGFQAKDKAQYYSNDNKKLLFSDIAVVIKMTVLHHTKVGFYSNNFSIGDYPYNVPSAQTVRTDTAEPVPVAAPPGSPQNEPGPQDPGQLGTVYSSVLAEAAGLGTATLNMGDENLLRPFDGYTDGALARLRAKTKLTLSPQGQGALAQDFGHDVDIQLRYDAPPPLDLDSSTDTYDWNINPEMTGENPESADFKSSLEF